MTDTHAAARAADADPHRPLREDVRLLGDLLGDTLRARAGAGVFDLVEEVRALAKRGRAGDADDFAALARRLGGMPIEAALPVARAFSQFLTLANIAEQHHRTRRRRAYRRTPDAAQVPWLLVVGVTALTAHYCLTRALRLAEMSVVLPIDFLRLPLVALLGYALYGETVGLLALAGALLIVAANVINLRAAQRHAG